MIQVHSTKIAHAVTLWVDLKLLNFETLSTQEPQDVLISLWTFNFEFSKFASFLKFVLILLRLIKEKMMMNKFETLQL